MEPRVIVEGIVLSGAIRLPPAEERHIVSALRMREGDRFILCDGAGQEALCALSAQREAIVLEPRQPQGEPVAQTHLYPSVAKGERFEWLLQKAVELGAVSVTPVLSCRCIAGAPSHDKRERWRKIMRGAAEQSGRARVPELREPLAFSDAVDAAQGLRLFCYEEEKTVSLKAVLRGNTHHVSIMTGPEGGYAPEEAQLAAQTGWQAVSLGNRVLRCETAPLMVLSAIQYEGD